MKIETDEKSVGMRSRIRERSIGGREGEDLAAPEGPEEARGGEEDAEEPADRPEEREGLDGGGMGKATDGCGARGGS